jgi:Putative porin
MIRYFSVLLLFAFSTGLSAQEQDSLKIRTLKQSNLSADSTGLFAQEQDSLKTRTLKQWNLSADFSEEESIPVDTVFSLFNRFKIADKYSPVNASLGNYGLPFYQMNFFDRVTDPNMFIYNSYYPFMFVPEKAIFMNTQVPFTELVWSYSGPKETAEQTFRIRHSQNVNRNLNFGLIYDIDYCLGQYNYQMAENKNFTFFSSYTGDKYKLYFSAGINSLTSYENGGITNKDELSNPEIDDMRDVTVNLGGLDNAVSLLKNKNLLLVQRYTLKSDPVIKADSVAPKAGLFGLSGTISHIFQLESNKRTYTDDLPLSGFYDTVLLNNEITFDSLSSRSLKNTIRFDFTTDETRKFRLGGGFGFRNEVMNYMQITSSTIPSPNYKNSRNLSNNAVVGRLYNRIGDKFGWLATGELFLSGYRVGDFNINGEISKSFDFKKGRLLWLITGGINNQQPSPWYEQWGSNNFEWQNNFDKELRIDIGSGINFPARNANIKFNYAIINNYTDFDINALPSQYSGGLSVAALIIQKNLSVWKFHLDSDVIAQQSSNEEILDLPLLTLRSAGYFEHLLYFKSTGGNLNLQLGFDATFHTLYHPYSYMPSTGRFFRQEQSVRGNYPFLNVFVNLKVKRTRLFFMFDHINSGMTGTNYDMIPYYPMNIRMFRYGLAWTFYN